MVEMQEVMVFSEVQASCHCLGVRWSLLLTFYVSSSIWVEFVSKNCVLIFSIFSLIGMRFSSLGVRSIGSSGGLILVC